VIGGTSSWSLVQLGASVASIKRCTFKRSLSATSIGKMNRGPEYRLGDKRERPLRVKSV